MGEGRFLSGPLNGIREHFHGLYVRSLERSVKFFLETLTREGQHAEGVLNSALPGIRAQERFFVFLWR